MRWTLHTAVNQLLCCMFLEPGFLHLLKNILKVWSSLFFVKFTSPNQMLSHASVAAAGVWMTEQRALLIARKRIAISNPAEGLCDQRLGNRTTCEKGSHRVPWHRDGAGGLPGPWVHKGQYPGKLLWAERHCEEDGLLTIKNNFVTIGWLGLGNRC